ncbi:class I SAM-dependent methyltransferase [Hafnia psychrotolerans]|uniref:Methyltransferase domain-containing protein n=1 Tax=Hafnia psychrotolerans TaxID=1477018 RepID=A0ABQ1GJC5_9GAMM|nr:class I SAM-dependent methyltransferase [Hafnia psychrotolerans]GGA44558.1 hypothetical protein GCM10011328_19560 [Hafnia psychrotolerans]
MNENFLYSNPELYEKVYPDVNNQRIKMCLIKIQRYLGELPSCLADFGCGLGRESNAFSSLGVDVTAVDINRDMINFAKRNGSATFILEDVCTVKLNQKFEVILSLGNVLSCFTSNQKLNAFLDNVTSHLEDDGLLIINLWNGARFLGKDIKELAHEVTIDIEGSNTCGKSIFILDRKNQQIKRIRNWTVSNAEIAIDNFSYRLFFPEELRYILESKGFEVVSMEDNDELIEGDFSGLELTITSKLTKR